VTRQASHDVAAVRGSFRILKDGRRRDTSYGSFSRAEAAALRLAEANPAEAFIITQEVARVERRQSRGASQ